MADAPKEQVKAFIVKGSDDTYRMVLKYSNGMERTSNERYATPEECQAAFDKWAKETGAVFTRAAQQ